MGRKRNIRTPYKKLVIKGMFLRGIETTETFGFLFRNLLLDLRAIRVVL
jgi:hypothetical protein